MYAESILIQKLDVYIYQNILIDWDMHDIKAKSSFHGDTLLPPRRLGRDGAEHAEVVSSLVADDMFNHDVGDARD